MGPLTGSHPNTLGNKRKIDKLGEKYSKEVKLKDEKLRQAENEIRKLANNITVLEKQMKKEKSTEHNRAIVVPKDGSKKTRDPAQLDTELCSKGSILEEEDVEVRSEEEKRGKEPIEEYDRREKKQKHKIKCYFYENMMCMKDECQYRHPKIVCKNYKQNKCEWGNQCNDKHPKNRKNSPQKEQHKRKVKEQNKCSKRMESDMEKLVSAVKEGFKIQNEFLALTIGNNNQIQQGQRQKNLLQYIPLSQMRV